MAGREKRMRVISGQYGGRRLAAVPGDVTRPTADRVREALFSRLDSRYGLAGRKLLDLFAGTGALGIEALSRGAHSVVCVEKNRRAARVLLANVDACDANGRVELFVREVAEILAAGGTRAPMEERRFDGVFVDPPYRKGYEVATLEALAATRLVVEGGWVVVESDAKEELADRFGYLVRVREDRYGDTKLSLYEAEASQQS